VLTANDLKIAHPLSSHLKETFRSPGAAFTGGIARISMKQIATSLNLYVPAEFKNDYPFMSAFAVGMGFSPILNIPRMMQLGRLSGLSYPQAFQSTFMTGAGLKGYAQNTMMFGPGEGFRMMMCFGTKDFLMPRIGGKEDAHMVRTRTNQTQTQTQTQTTQTQTTQTQTQITNPDNPDPDPDKYYLHALVSNVKTSIQWIFHNTLQRERSSNTLSYGLNPILLKGSRFRRSVGVWKLCPICGEETRTPVSSDCIHTFDDSNAILFPYVAACNDPFLLTWTLT
jgi:hypothetical protein